MLNNPFTSWLYPIIVKLSRKLPSPNNKRFSISTAKNVLLLFSLDSNSYRKTLHEFSDGFEAMGIKVSSIEYIDKKNNDFIELKERNHYNLTDKDLNFWGLPKKIFRQKTLTKSFDLVINFSLKNILAFHYLVRISGANLKIGFLEDEFINTYDFIINHKGNCNLMEHKEAIFEYLKKINKS